MAVRRADGWIVVFALPKGTSAADRVRFHDGLWGRTVTSHGGKYSSHREGLMEKVPHRRLTRAVFLIRDQDVARVRVFLREWGVEWFIRHVRLEAEDLDRMGPPA